MKSVNITFTEEEFAFLEQEKKRRKLNWHDFLLSFFEQEENIDG